MGSKISDPLKTTESITLHCSLFVVFHCFTPRYFTATATPYWQFNLASSNATKLICLASGRQKIAKSEGQNLIFELGT